MFAVLISLAAFTLCGFIALLLFIDGKYHAACFNWFLSGINFGSFLINFFKLL